MRWIKSLGVVGLGWLIVAFLPNLKAQSKKYKYATPVKQQPRRAPAKARPAKRVKKARTAKRVKRAMVRLRPVRVRIRPLAVKKPGAKGSKKVKKIQVACRMILLIKGMT